MRKLRWVFLASVFAVCGALSAALQAQDAKPVSLLASEADVAKIQALVQTADYAAVTEDEYVAAMKNLVAVAKSVDISKDGGKKKAGLIYMHAVVFQKKAKDPKAYSYDDGKCVCDDNWFDGKAASVAGEMKKFKQDQWIKKIDDRFTSDEAKMREEFQAAKAPAK